MILPGILQLNRPSSLEEPMPRLLTGIEWFDNLGFMGSMPPKETRHLTVTVDGDERDGTWKDGVGIYVAERDIGKGDTFEIDEVTNTRRIRYMGRRRH